MRTLSDLLSRKIVIKIPAWTFLLLPLLAYAAWESYWYTKVGLRIVKWHTHVAVFVYLWTAGIFLFVLLKKKFPSLSNNVFLLFSSLVFSLMLIEIFLSISGHLKTYMEKCTGYYTSPYEPLDKDHYHVWSPNIPHEIKKPEYSFVFPTNSLGLADREWTVAKKAGEKRILSLGDSFTEGDGAPYDSGYVSLLKKRLMAESDSFYVMNGGVCGSDPFNNYIFLKNRLLVYKPDIVIQVLATNDLNTDIILRGGLERFQKDGTQKYEPAPWWEPIYAVSYISRLYFRMAGYNELLRNSDLSAEEKAGLNTKVTALFQSYIALCRERNIRLVLVLRPDKDEIRKNKYDYDFGPILSSIQAQGDVQILDLLPYYRAYIEKANTDAADYFWVADGHHNSRGYEMMAQAIYENLRPLLRDSITTAGR